MAGIAQAVPAAAQDVPPEVQVSPVTEPVQESNSVVDLENIVTSAAKNVTTIQEAPGIVTVITSEDIRRWGYRTLEDVLADIPGWSRYDTEGQAIPSIMTRGVVQGMLLLRNGVPASDPFANTQAMNRSIPLESLKRIEVVTGPGGVLWGANSFLGIVNLITKDAEDVGGGEAGAGYGDGRGNRSDIRTYAMVGTTLASGRVKVFVHTSYENYVGQELTVRQFLAGPIPPQPNGTALYGPVQTSDVQRSWVLDVDGKITAGPLSLYWLWSDGKLRWGGTFPGGAATTTADATTDPRGVATDNVVNRFDRMVALQYHSAGRIDVDAKAYLTEAFFQFDPILFFPASSLVTGGVVGTTVATPYRTGVTLDTGIALPYSNRLLFGGEAFYEWADGSTLHFLSPDPALGPNKLPFLCPRSGMGASYTPTCPVPFAFSASREVAAVFVSDQWRLLPSLLFDGGARAQAGFGDRPYDRLVLFSGALVWNFARGFHLKGNFAQGFRPPVFNNTDSNGAAAEYAGSQSLKNEFSNSLQGELNARILRNLRRIRDLSFRADYSYTILDNTIVVNEGQYLNSGRRGISSAEFFGRLHLAGEHQIQLGYTFLQITDEAKGIVRFTPNHWFTINGSFSLIPGRLELISTLLVAGAAEDPNRLPRSITCAPGLPPTPANCGGDATASSLSFDRIPAVALWNLGARVRGLFNESIELDAFVYNVLDQHWYQPDGFYDFAPTTETQPFPGAGFSFFAQARYRY